MKICRVTPGNFGDDLNDIIIKEYLGDRFSGNIYLNGTGNYDLTESDEMTLAIGTILNRRVPAIGTKHVLGAGYGYGLAPNIDESWKFHFVRGPLTAKILGLDGNAYITDPAILLADYKLKTRQVTHQFGFISHHGCINEHWMKLCLSLNIKYIDIRQSFDVVMNEISSCEIILAEAMHGAIVADSLRIPWIPIKTADKINDFKWNDWCGSMKITYEPHHLLSLWDSNNPLKEIFTKVKTKTNRKRLSDVIRNTRPILSEEHVFKDNLEKVRDSYHRFFDKL